MEQGDWAAALLDPEATLPPGLTSWNGSDPGQRFGVYRNNVLVSLTEALAQTFPVVRQLVGGEFFDAMAREYVRARPPRSALLAHYGRDFADFVRGFPPAAVVPYLADVARLEMAWLEALHAADAGAVEAQLLGELLGEPARLAGLGIRLHPSLQSLRSPFAIFSIWAAHQGEADIAGTDPAAAECGWVLRAGLEVKVLRRCGGDCDFVEALAAGAAFGEAAEAAAADEEFELDRCLAALLCWGMLVAVD